MHKKSSGFTLIELLIAVAVVGILVSVAYPSYQEFVRDSNRATAEGVVLEMGQWMERQFTVNGRYTDASNASPSLPLAKSPKDGADVHYVLGVNATATTFTITATASGAQQGDACGNLTLTQAGVKGATGSGTDCWDD
ncbi:type IV pilin protein [Neptuniibacter caesariensis]|uniref:Fimbrial protein pilin n=1 Tax=Neptuniibacter caesariensis TaxID=207954 RepID=A0A7U8C4M4_NEPCE|nr:type IV pilin protein [Neptuniibacter caesariensis]EAR61470.1 Fimbrial protein pilin [Oceanospirillum sp. MED92] [Neptuniibacter caesariensis]